MKRVLVVDDEPGLRQSLGLLLSDAGYAVTAESDGQKALDRALAEPFDLVLCDVRMPEMDGLTFLRTYRSRGGEGLVIMMSAYGGEDAALAAMKEGAYDYLTKPFRPDEVVLTLRKAEERERLGRDVAGLRAQLATGPAELGLVAESRAMHAALDLVARVAEHNTTVLITGESGTGKEVIARAIHRASPRALRPFVGINCAAIPESLLESELFGHVRGAFTGATADKAGLFDQANGGTLLLDEIGEMPVGLQAKLLRVLQEGEIRRVGDQKTRRVDVRVLAATARDLAAEAAAGRFREDLFYRLNVVAIELPPLSQRREDIAPLARHFVARLAQRFGRPLALSEDAVAWLEEHEWRGNVRELENAIERAVVLTDRNELEPGDFRVVPPLRNAERGSGGEDHAERGRGGEDHAERGPGGEATLNDVVEAAEREAIAAALGATDGNRRAAAKRLGVSLRTLFYKMSRYGLD
jgi:two-component system response regulator AtoC